MLSKEMYKLLSKIPRYPEKVPYQDLVSGLNEKEAANLYNRIVEAKYDCYDYISLHGGTTKSGSYSLTEKGVAAIEDYEQNRRSHRWVIASAAIAFTAMVAAVASAVAAFLALQA